MRIAYFDCFAGVSGNMILGALLNAGLSRSDLEEDLDSLDLQGWKLSVSNGIRKGMAGTHVEVVQTHAEHAHRTIRDIERIVTAASLPTEVRDQAMQVFERIARAEGRIHGIPDTEVHFHEVGAIDAIIDVVGAIAGLRRLELDTVWASPIHVGTGFVEAAHGRIPVPAPATLEILKGVPVYATDVPGELATPTGAAILRTVVGSFGSWPEMKVDQIGYGLGTKEFPIPNVLRLAIGTLEKRRPVDHPIPAIALHEHGIESGHRHDCAGTHECPHGKSNEQAEAACERKCDAPQPYRGLQHDVIEVLEANLDDMNPEFADHVTCELQKQGALDVFFTPIVMKKGRPALKLTVLAAPPAVPGCAAVILRQTTSLGVRVFPAHRHKLLRSWIDVIADGHSVRVKLGMWGEEVVNIAPEHEDCLRAAQETGTPLKEIYDSAKAAALAQLHDIG